MKISMNWMCLIQLHFIKICLTIDNNVLFNRKDSLNSNINNEFDHLNKINSIVDSKFKRQNLNEPNNNECVDNSGLSLKFSKEECSISLESTICLGNNNHRVILNDNFPENLVSYWSYDSKRIVDESSGKNHSNQILNFHGFAPGVNGIGNSLEVNGVQKNYDYFLKTEINHKITNKFTYSFWFYPISADSNKSNNRILQRGSDSLENSPKRCQRLPAIFFNSKNKGLLVYLNTYNEQDDKEGEFIISNGGANYKRWINITLMKSDLMMSLFLNGSLDSKLRLTSGIFEPDSMILDNSIYIGSQNFNFYLDELKYFNDIVDIDYIQASVSSVLPGVSYLYQYSLGCINCNFETAKSACSNNYKICSSLEMHLGGYQLANSVNWLKNGMPIWSKEYFDSNNQSNTDLRGLVLCCIED